jgi:hypothetical protein
LRDWVFEKLLLALQGRNCDIGLLAPDHRVGATRILLNSELVYFVRHGKVKPRPDVARFDGRTVHFVDGSSTEFDAVIACTGCWFSYLSLDTCFWMPASLISLWVRCRCTRA